jgi:hypothetical protein
MRRLLVFAALLIGVLIPAVVSAQGETIINELRVKLWPEYDRSDLLVIYDFTLAPGTVTPTTLNMRVPADADITAVAQQTPTGLFVVNFKTGVKGDWQTVTFDVTDKSAYRLEYYVPIQKKDSTRQFNFIWPGDYAVNTLVVEAQEPPKTTDFTTNPVLPNVETTTDGLSTHSGTFGSLKKDEQWTLQANYSRTTDELTVSGQPVQPSGGTLDGNASWSASLLDFFSRNPLYILGFLGVLLIFAGLIWYWQTGPSGRSKKSRRRHVSHSESNTSDEQIYCPQCGKRAQPADKFCRACGSRLRREEM